MPNGIGHQPDAPDPGRVQPPPNPRAVSLYKQGDGFRTIITPEGEDGGIVKKECENIEIVDICGGQTDVQTGQDVLMLSEYTCLPAGAFSIQNIYFVATPHFTSPVFLTSQIESEQSDIKITVFGWRPDGNRSGRVNFDWHCCAQLSRS